MKYLLQLKKMLSFYFYTVKAKAVNLHFAETAKKGSLSASNLAAPLSYREQPCLDLELSLTMSQKWILMLGKQNNKKSHQNHTN